MRRMRLMGLTLMLALAGCAQRVPLDQQAVTAMKAQCSNDVVGITRVVSTRLEMGSNFAPDTWTGEIVAERVNENGGVIRTNLQYRFGEVKGNGRPPTVIVLGRK